MKDKLSHITDWIFDLDNTLYPRHCDLFAQIDVKMNEYVAGLLDLDLVAARKVQKELYRDYGTTLRGLMEQYHVEPYEFLHAVHDIDYSMVEPNPELGKMIGSLPGRKHIFTNADTDHAVRTIEQLGIAENFDQIFDIVAADMIPKPDSAPYEMFITTHGVDAERAVMFEDMPRNLDVPKEMGMATVLVLPQEDSDFNAEAWEHAGHDDGQIDFVTRDINEFLAEVLVAID
jgi:putative hydrolase of the HAD superfamily